MNWTILCIPIIVTIVGFSCQSIWQKHAVIVWYSHYLTCIVSAYRDHDSDGGYGHTHARDHETCLHERLTRLATRTSRRSLILIQGVVSKDEVHTHYHGSQHRSGGCADPRALWYDQLKYPSQCCHGVVHAGPRGYFPKNGACQFNNHAIWEHIYGLMCHCMHAPYNIMYAQYSLGLLIGLCICVHATGKLSKDY